VLRSVTKYAISCKFARVLIGTSAAYIEGELLVSNTNPTLWRCYTASQVPARRRVSQGRKALRRQIGLGSRLAEVDAQLVRHEVDIRLGKHRRMITGHPVKFDSA
jgi:hypothetical protein